METGRIALIFFYGVFWATIVSAVGRYSPFNTAAFFSQEKRRHAFFRFLMSFTILNILPITWLLLLCLIIPDTSGVRPVIAAAVASLSVFGFHRILLFVIGVVKT